VGAQVINLRRDRAAGGQSRGLATIWSAAISGSAELPLYVHPPGTKPNAIYPLVASTVIRQPSKLQFRIVTAFGSMALISAIYSFESTCSRLLVLTRGYLRHTCEHQTKLHGPHLSRPYPGPGEIGGSSVIGRSPIFRLIPTIRISHRPWPSLAISAMARMTASRAQRRRAARSGLAPRARVQCFAITYPPTDR
jgi:hypothetical protein